MIYFNNFPLYQWLLTGGPPITSGFCKYLKQSGVIIIFIAIHQPFIRLLYKYIVFNHLAIHGKTDILKSDQ